MSPEAWAEPDGKWLTTSQGDFSGAFQKRAHNLHEFLFHILQLAMHLCIHACILKLRCSNIDLCLQTGLEVLFDFRLTFAAVFTFFLYERFIELFTQLNQ